MKLNPMLIGAAIAPLVIAAPIAAQTELKAPSTTTTLTAPDSKTKSSYKKSTWDRRQGALKAGGDSREIPPTDCPPLPTQHCLDTWDDEKASAGSPD